MTTSGPSSDLDIYADEHILDPYPAYRTLRDLGPAVWLERYQVWAVTRYRAVYDALHDPHTFSSASGVALTPETNQMLMGNTVSSDPPEHDRLRALIAPRLNPRALRAYSDEVQRRAIALVDDLIARGSFDAVSDFAQVFPVSLVPDLLGWPEKGRDRLLTWASAGFNTIGPMNQRTIESVPALQEMSGYVAGLVSENDLRKGSWGAELLDSGRERDLSEDVLAKLLMDYLLPSLDTTISALASMILLFGQNPAQWDQIRARPEAIPNAFNEVVRLESPIRGFYRHLKQDAKVDDVTIPKGSWAIVLNASANRDEQHWEKPDAFDITRRAAEHVGFGHGVHSCVGQGLARLEGHALLTALATRVRRFDVDNAQWGLNNTIRALKSLHVTVHAA